MNVFWGFLYDIIAYSVGFMMTAMIGYFVRDDVNLQVIMAAMSVSLLSSLVGIVGLLHKGCMDMNVFKLMFDSIANIMGFMMMAVIGYFVRDDVILQVIMAVMPCVIVLAFW